MATVKGRCVLLYILQIHLSTPARQRLATVHIAFSSLRLCLQSELEKKKTQKKMEISIMHP